MTEQNTQLTSAFGFNTKNIIFSEPILGTVPNSNPQMNFQRVMISTKNPDGSVGELILPTEKVFSFGVSENKNLETGKTNGYVLPLCLHNRDGATKKEKEWVETFNNIIDKCKDWLITNKEKIGQYELERNDLKKLNPLYFKKDKGKVIEGTGPSLYAKLIISKKQNKVVTMFFGKNGENLDAMELKGKYCYAIGAIKIESIFIGNKISIQAKLYEAEIHPMDSTMKKLLTRPTPQPRVLVTENTSNPMNNEADVEDEEDDISGGNGSLDESENFPILEEETKMSNLSLEEDKKKVIKKVIKKVVPKK
jgi:hypothetical protein